jgi:hypothetical protein
MGVATRCNAKNGPTSREEKAKRHPSGFHAREFGGRYPSVVWHVKTPESRSLENPRFVDRCIKRECQIRRN